MNEGHVYYSDQRTFETTNHRTNEPSEQWTFGAKNLRNTGKPPIIQVGLAYYLLMYRDF